MTYRSFFILLEGFSRLLLAARLRAGIVSGEPVRAARAATRALGGLVLQTVDLSQRTWDVMLLRGYERRLIVEIRHGQAPVVDVVVVVVALALLTTSLAWRFFWPLLNPVSWAPVAVALLTLGGALLLAGAPRRTPAAASPGRDS